MNQQAHRRDRNARLATSLSGSNLTRVGDFNQRVVLQAIRLAGAMTKTELARTTGLTFPTIVNITKRLVDADLIREVAKEKGRRGSPASRLAINPNGCFSIGINIDRDHVTIVLMDLTGAIRARRVRDVDFAMPEDVIGFAQADFEQMLLDEQVTRERVLGIGVALPDDLGSVSLPHRPDSYSAWNETDLAARLKAAFTLPIYIDNDAAAAAIGEAQFGAGQELQSFFYLLLSAGLGGALVVEGEFVTGSDGRAGEIGFLPLNPRDEVGPTVQDIVSISALRDRLEQEGVAGWVTEMPYGGEASPVISRWIDDAVAALHGPLLAVNALINPKGILVGGRLPGPVLQTLADRLDIALATNRSTVPRIAKVSRASLYMDASAVGAAILPLMDTVLPLQASLMKRRGI